MVCASTKQSTIEICGLIGKITFSDPSSDVIPTGEATVEVTEEVAVVSEQASLVSEATETIQPQPLSHDVSLITL